MAEPFLGQISIVGFNYAPRGFALCDGQLLPVNQNQALFSLLGTNYGGDGRTTFALPDLRGRAAMQPDDPGRPGGRFGAETVTLLGYQLPAHSHTLQASTDLANSEQPAGALPAGRGRGGPLMYAAPDAGDAVTMHADTLSALGGNRPHDNMQPFVTVNFVIALQGIFPSRN